MPIPRSEDAFVPVDKCTGYLLNANHPEGGSKARWFESIGYRLDDPLRLETDLLELVRHSDDFAIEQSSFGVKYEVRGTITSPQGVPANIVTVWIQEPGTQGPRLVTAVPGRKSK